MSKQTPPSLLLLPQVVHLNTLLLDLAEYAEGKKSSVHVANYLEWNQSSSRREILVPMKNRSNDLSFLKLNITVIHVLLGNEARPERPESGVRVSSTASG